MKDIITLKKMLCQVKAILDRKQKSLIILLFFVILIGALFELLGVAAMMPFLQSLLVPNELIKKPYVAFFINLFGIKTVNNLVVLVGIGIVLLYIIKNVYLSFSAYLQAFVGNNINKDLSVLMLKSYMERPYRFFVENGSSEIMRGVSADTDGVYQVVRNGVKLLSEGMVIISVSLLLLYTDMLLAMGVVIVGLFCLFIIICLLKKKISKLSYISRNAIAQKNKWMVETVYGIKDIKVLNRKKYFVNQYCDSYEEVNIANIKFTFFGAIPERMIEAFCVSGIILFVIVRLLLGVSVNEFIPKLSVFAMGAFRLLPSISRTAGYINELFYYRPMVESTYNNITMARDYLNQINAIVVKSDEDGHEFIKRVRLDSIDWKYPDGEKYIFNRLILEIEKGQAIGIIGESGVGKSTLADILLRLYLPLSGRILMDGIDINSIPNSWANTIGYVPQTVFLMDDTIRANIVFGDDTVDDDRVWKSLEQASLSEFVKSLSDGLDTIVGERGIKFSGGQRQRIAIARALYNNPQILILDEATAALDNETEEAVMEAIESLAGSMTLIIIAHRVTTLKNCDRIYEIVDGKAVERNKEEVIHI